METVEYKNVSFTVWDVGGQDKVLANSCFFFFFFKTNFSGVVLCRFHKQSGRECRCTCFVYLIICRSTDLCDCNIDYFESFSERDFVMLEKLEIKGRVKLMGICS